MKKTLAFLLTISMLFALTACGTAAAPAAEPIYVPAAAEAPAETPTETAAPEEAPAEDSAEPVVSVSVSTERAYEYTEMDFCLASYECAWPTVSVAGRESAERAINASVKEKNTRLRDGTEGDGISGWEGMRTAAREDYDWRVETGEALENWYDGYALERNVVSIWSGAELLSLELGDYTYTNGVHGYTAYFGWNYDLTTGAERMLADLSERPDFAGFCLQRVTELSHDSELYDPLMFFEGYEEYLGDVVSDGSWYFTEEGLTFLANAYLLAPYAAGCLRFTLPWAELTEWLKPEYLFETQSADGILSGALAEDLTGCTYAVDETADWPNAFAKEGGFPSGTPAADAPLGQPIVFTAESEARNVSLRHLEYWEYSDIFDPSDTVFYVSRLRAGESVGVTTLVPDVIPGLGVYVGEKGQTIFLSGMDGSLILNDIG